MWWLNISIQSVKWLFWARLFQLFYTISQHTYQRARHLFKLLKPPAYHLCRIKSFGIRVINDWNNLTSDIVTNSSLNSFKLAVDNYFYDFIFIVNVFNVNIISVANFVCVLLYCIYVIEQVYRLLSPNPELQS